MKWLMTDAAHIKVHHHTAGGNEGISYTKGAECQTVPSSRHLQDAGKICVSRKQCGRLVVSEVLIADTVTGKLQADKAHDSDVIRNLAVSQRVDAVIPPKANRKEQPPFDRYRHLLGKTLLGFQMLAGHQHTLYKETSFVFGGNRNLDYCEMAEDIVTICPR